MRILGILVLFASAADASCRMVTSYDDYGNYQGVNQICTNAFDMPSIQAIPSRQLTMPTMKPMQPMQLAPLGTATCNMQWVCGSGIGNCGWQNICR